MTFTVLIPEKVSLNKIYAGVHFRKRMQHKVDYDYCIREAKLSPWTGDFPVHIAYHFKLTGKPLDIDNHVYMCKLLADTLVTHGILPGDEQTYIGSITITAEQLAKHDTNRVDVTITPCASTSHFQS